MNYLITVSRTIKLNFFQRIKFNRLLKKGLVISAVKYVRSCNPGLNLKDAKDYTDLFRFPGEENG